MAIQIKTLEQLKVMRRAGLVVAEIHQAIRAAIKPGMTTSALDAVAAACIKRNGATPTSLTITAFPQRSAFLLMKKSFTVSLAIALSTMEI